MAGEEAQPLRRQRTRLTIGNIVIPRIGVAEETDL